jgi:hypothetical protein
MVMLISFPQTVIHSLLKEGNSVICDNINVPEDIILSKISQAQKDKFYMISLKLLNLNLNKSIS